MKLISASSRSRKNVQIAIRIAVIALIPLIDFSWIAVAWAFIAYLGYYTIAHSIMLHRYYSHSSFEFKFKPVRQLFALITAMSVRGDPIGWAYLHKMHHATVDSEEDPHSPHFKQFNFFEIGDYTAITEKINPLKIRSLLTTENLFLNKYYWLVCLTLPFLLACLSLDVFYFAWLLPICMFDFASTFFNYANHKNLPGSYTSFATSNTGKSVNNKLLWIISLGEAWHNNHHHNPKNYNFKIKWWEFDPSSYIINVIKR